MFLCSFVGEGSDFVKAVALGSVQMGGIVHSAPLPPLSGKLPLGQTERTLTLAAGKCSHLLVMKFSNIKRKYYSF